MNGAIFVDTGAWIALADRSDSLHPTATQAYPVLLTSGRPLVTSNLVVAETYSLLRRRLEMAAGMRFLTAIRQSPRMQLPDRWIRAVAALSVTTRPRQPACRQPMRRSTAPELPTRKSMSTPRSACST